LGTVKGFALFDTPIGCCAVSWSAAGISGLWLPGVSRAALRERVERRLGGARESAPPGRVASVLGAIVQLTSGVRIDLRHTALDMSGVPEFHRRVYDAARLIGPGETETYGDVARRLNVPGAARAVGQALGRNPFAIIVPCHRVVAANGQLGGFSAPGGLATKIRLLQIEQMAGDQPGLFAG
jgi:methylated-DNA-[protein]-cysteine S-methyltransferase